MAKARVRANKIMPADRSWRAALGAFAVRAGRGVRSSHVVDAMIAGRFDPWAGRKPA
jgi:hypothetical protein